MRQLFVPESRFTKDYTRTPVLLGSILGQSIETS
jgi:hypothetical protein